MGMDCKKTYIYKMYILIKFKLILLFIKKIE